MQVPSLKTPLFILLYLVGVNSLNYVVSAPNIFRLDVPETIGISLSDSDNPVTFKVLIQSHPNKTELAQQTLVVESGKPQITTLTFPQSAIDEIQKDDEVLFVYLVVTAPFGNFHTKEILIPVKKYSGYAFVHTDKLLYSPSDVVHIRILNLNEKLIPNDKAIYLEIKNPNAIRVLYEKFDADDKGIIEYKFYLPYFPVCGIWSVSIKYGYELAGVKTVHFEVKEYELPTFSVKIQPPKIVLNNQKMIKTRVTAFYVYGKPVVGLLNIKFSIKTSKGCLFVIGSMYLQPLIKGQRWIRMDVERDIKSNGMVWFPKINGSSLIIEAEVIEKDTGNRKTAIDYSSPFSYSPYIVSFPRNSLHFKPGVPYQIRVDVTLMDGKPASRIPVRLMRSLAKKNGQVLRNLSIPMPSNTNDVGRVTFQLDTRTEDEELEITVSTGDKKLHKENQATNILNVFRFSSADNQSYIWIAAPPDEMIFQVGKPFQTQVTVVPAENNVKLHYMVVSRGMVLLQDETPAQGNATVHPIQFIVTADMSPSARIIVYTIKNNKIIADSIKIEVEKICKYNNGDNLKIAAKTTGPYKPGQKVDIEVTGERDSYVGLLAVDEAVYLLNKERFLTRKTMFDEMESHDLGWGASGSENTEQVFRKTGFVVLSNADVEDHSSIDGECDKKQHKKVNHKNTALAAFCCKLGRSRGPPNMDCNERAARIYQAINDTANCTEAFLDCCQKHVHRAIARSVITSKAKDTTFDSYDFIDESEVHVLQNSASIFSETWYFNTKKITGNKCYEENNNSCIYNYQSDFPRSITTWRVQALAVSQQTGLCISEPLSLTIFKDLIIQMQLPYSAIRMEQILVPVTVFNYGDEDLQVSIYMFGIEGVCLGAGPGERSDIQKIIIPPNNASTVTFPIMPLEVGSYRLRVVAFSWSNSDVVEKTLVVVPEGIPVKKSLSLTLDPMGLLRHRKIRSTANLGIEETFDKKHSRQSLVIDLPLPKEYIPGTEKCIVTITGDFYVKAVTTSIEDLESQFFHLPTGEQAMIRLAPLVYSMLYLNRTNRLTPIGEKTGYRWMQLGYAHMLQYRKADGSFAIWQHAASSTWLTALAAKILCHASLFIDVPDEVHCNALNWLLSKQKDSDAFYADFGIYHQKIKDDVNSEATLTAYILISLTDCNKCDSVDKQIASAQAISYLEHHIDFLTDEYSLAVCTYALALVNSSKAAEANENLKALAIYVNATNTRYWDINHTEFPDQKPWIYTKRPSALAVETTSYALLTQLLLDDLVYSHPIANWLHQQRNAKEAFVSTRDTIIALQALAEYSYRANFPTLDVTCNISNQATRRNQSIRITKEITLALVVLPAGIKVHVDVEGKGVGTMTMTMAYNVEDNKREECKFDLKIKTIETEDVIKPQIAQIDRMKPRCGMGSGYGYEDEYEYEDNFSTNCKAESKHSVKLDICLRYLEDGPVGMSILDIGLFTGHKPVKDDLTKLLTDGVIAKYELSNTRIVLYLNKVPNDKDLCVQLRTTQELKVGKVQPTTVKIYNYYEPDNKCEKYYKPDDGSSLLIPICEGRQCRCTEGQCPTCFPFEDIKKDDDTRDQRKKLMSFACDKHNFVWNGTLLVRREVDGFAYYDFLVTQVLVEGLQSKEELEENIVTFTGSSACNCPKMKEGKIYIIMGRDGFPYKDEENIWKYKYTFDSKTSVHEMRLLRTVSDPKERDLQKNFFWFYRRMSTMAIDCHM